MGLKKKGGQRGEEEEGRHAEEK